MSGIGVRDRIDSLDVIRGVAVLFLLQVHMLVFGASGDVAEYPPALGFPGGPGWTSGDAALLTGLDTALLGTMRGLLSLLFGAGVLLVTRAGEAGQDRADIYYRRTIALVVLGLVHGYLLLFPGDILFVYGIAGLFLYPWRNAKPASLLFAGLTVLAAMTLWAGLDSYASNAVAETADADAATSREARINAAVAALRGGYLDNLAVAARWLDEFNAWQTLAWWVLDSLGFMLIGMALFKWGVLQGRVPTALLAAFVVVGYAIGLPLRYLSGLSLIESDYDAYAPLYATLEQVLRLLVTFAHLGAILLLLRAPGLKRLMGVFSAPGRMALTIYLSQSILGALVFTGVGFGLGHTMTYSQLIGVGFLWMLGLTLFARGWLAVFAYGPVEWVWRWFSYAARPRLFRPRTPVAAA